MEINKIKDNLDYLVNEKFDKEFNKLVEEIAIDSKNKKHPIVTSFKELMVITNKRESKLNMLHMVGITFRRLIQIIIKICIAETLY